MSVTEARQIAVVPIIHYPHEVEPGRTYLLTVDLRPILEGEWPYAEEEYAVHCLLDTAPLFHSVPLGEPIVMLHRFGGSYGPAKFLLTAAQDEHEGHITVSLASAEGMPILEIPLSSIRLRHGNGLTDLPTGVRFDPQSSKSPARSNSQIASSPDAETRWQGNEALIQQYLDWFLADIGAMLEQTLTLSAQETNSAVEMRPRILHHITLPHMRSDEPDPAGERVFETFQAAFETLGHRVLLLGVPGAGKTTTLLQFAYQAATARRDDPTKPIPLFASIHRLDLQRPLLESVQAVIETEFSGIQLDDQFLLYIFDGLDELGGKQPVNSENPGGEKYDPRERFLKAVDDQLSDALIVISCREADYQQIGEKAVLRGAVTLLPLETEQIESFVKSRNQYHLWQALVTDAVLLELCRTPLLLALLSLAVGEESVRVQLDAFSLTMTTIFDFYINARFSHEAVKRALPFDERSTRSMLSTLAASMWGDYHNPVTTLEFTEVEQVLGGRGQEFVSFACSMNFLRELSSENVQFIHRGFRDYFAVPALLEALNAPDDNVRKNATEALKKIQKSGQDEEVLKTDSPSMGERMQPPKITLSKGDPGIYWGGTLLPSAISRDNFMVAGVSGSGKTCTIRLLMQSVLPLIRPGDGQRVVIYDPKREMPAILHALDLKCPFVILNPFDARGVAWDIGADVTSPAIAHQVATVLIPSEPHTSQSFFTDAARQLVAGVMIAFNHNTPKQWSFRDVILATQNKDRLQEVLSLTQETIHLLEVVEESHTMTNIIATIRKGLTPYEAVATVSDHAETKWSLRHWIEEPNAESIMILDGTAIRLIFNCLCLHLLAQPESSTRRTWIFLDDAVESGVLDGLNDLLSIGRSKGTIAVIGFQDIVGLRAVYGNRVTNALIDQCGNKAVLRLRNSDSAEWASALFNAEEQRMISVSQASSDYPGAKSHDDSLGHRKITRPNILPSEFMEIPPANGRNGLTGYYDTSITGAYKATIKNLSRLLVRPDRNFPGYIARRQAEQYLPSWTKDDLHRLRLTADDTLVETKPIPDNADTLGIGDKASVDALKFRVGLTTQQAATFVRDLRLIGTPRALQILRGYLKDRRRAVILELAQAINPLELQAVQNMIRRSSPLPNDIRSLIRDLGPLPHVSGINSLNLEGTGVTDISPLAHIADLQHLNLCGLPISDVTPLANLSNLKVLDLRRTQVSDLAPLSGLINLTALYLNNTPVRDLTPVAALSNLETLNIQSTNVDDLTPLAGLSNLKIIHVRGTPARRSGQASSDVLTTYNVPTLPP